MDVATVEVRKNAQSTTWYNARVEDIVGDNIRVSFEDDVWPAREVPCDSVRRRPPSRPEDDGFALEVEESVEIYVDASEMNPSAWALGRVTGKKHDFFYVSLQTAGGKGASTDRIVEKSALRMPSEEPQLGTHGLVRRVVEVEEDLYDWVCSEDSLGCLADVKVKCGLVVAACAGSRDDPEDSPRVLLIGEESGVDLGERLLTMIHFKNQAQMQLFDRHREILLARLEELQHTRNKLHYEIFDVDSSVAGRIIGKKGERLKQLKEKHGVDIILRDIEAKKGEQRTRVTVSGECKEATKKAREEMEFVIATVPIQPDEVGWVLGKGMVWMKEVAKMTELQYARYNDKANALELCGLQSQVDDAMMLISVHREYLPVKQDMDKETEQIQESFEKLETAAPRKGKGKDAREDKGNGAKSKGKGGKGKASRGKPREGAADEAADAVEAPE